MKETKENQPLSSLFKKNYSATRYVSQEFVLANGSLFFKGVVSEPVSLKELCLQKIVKEKVDSKLQLPLELDIKIQKRLT